MNVINFAQGSMVMAGMYVTYFAAVDLSIDPIIATPIAVLALAGLGYLIYQGIMRHLVGRPPLMPILATFGLALIIQYVIEGLFGTSFRTPPAHLINRTSTVTIAGLSGSVPSIVGFVVAIVCTVGLALFITKSNTGKSMRAVAQDREAAAILGVNVARIDQLAWVSAGGLAGLAGGLLSMQYQVQPGIGTELIVYAFAAVALGGFNSVSGPAIAAIAVGVGAVVVGSVWEPQFEDATVFTVLILAIVFRAQRRIAQGTR